MIGKDGSLISRTDDDHELSARRVRERERENDGDKRRVYSHDPRANLRREAYRV